MTREDTMGQLLDIASGKPKELMAWIARLQRNEKQQILPSVANAMLIFANDPELTGMIVYNEFLSRAVLTRSPPEMDGVKTPGPFPRTWEEHDRTFCLAYLQRVYSSQFKMESVTSTMAGASVAIKFHPVRDYLATLKWDGIPRIGSWLTEAFGADVDPYHHAVGSKFLRAAVRRVLYPGCKFDSVLILEGPQNIGKSRAARKLFGDEWFTDNLPSDLSSRDTQDQLQGVWGVEFGEIEHLLRSEPETIKAFLSRQVDRYRPSYGRMPVERPRQCVFIGTTNQDDYARDPTGNRRLWPVKCEFANVEWIEGWRDQIWAEAVATEPNSPLWLEEELVQQEALEQQAARHDDDPWDARILDSIRGMNSISIPDLMHDILFIPVERHTKSQQMRIAKLLKRSGWVKDRTMEKGERSRRWVRCQ